MRVVSEKKATSLITRAKAGTQKKFIEAAEIAMAEVNKKYEEAGCNPSFLKNPMLWIMALAMTLLGGGIMVYVVNQPKKKPGDKQVA